MHPDVTPNEAAAALDAVERGRQRVIQEIDLPRWYWWGLAIGWVVLGRLTDLDHPWLTTAATLAFGAIHATVASRVLSGRHRSPNLSVRASIAGHEAPRFVITALLLLAAVTVAGSLAAQADGARHPVTLTSIVVAILIVTGGPHLLALVRRRAAARTAATPA
jgi:hypothetical protein